MRFLRYLLVLMFVLSLSGSLWAASYKVEKAELKNGTFSFRICNLPDDDWPITFFLNDKKVAEPGTIPPTKCIKGKIKNVKSGDKVRVNVFGIDENGNDGFGNEMNITLKVGSSSGSGQGSSTLKNEKVEFDGSKVFLRICGFYKGKRWNVNFHVDHKWKAMENVNPSSGCLEITIKDVKPGDLVVAKVSNYPEDGNDYKFEIKIPSVGINPPPPIRTVKPTARPTAVPTRPVDNRPMIDLGKVRRSARIAAENMISKVTSVYGELENIRYHLQKGFRFGTDFIRQNRLTGEEEYDEGLYRGRVEANANAASAGSSKGASVGSEAGRHNAINRFKRAAEAGLEQEPNLEPPVTEISFSGLAPNVAFPGNFSEYMRKNKPKLNDYLVKYSWQWRTRYGRLTIDEILYDGYLELWDLSNFYDKGYSFELLKSYWRADWAFEAWLKKWADDASLVKHYKSYPRRFRQGRSGQLEFERAFKAYYDNNIDVELERVIRRSSRAGDVAFEEGARWAAKVAKVYADKIGFYEGYKEVFREETIQPYKQAYAEAILLSFNRTVKQYLSSAVLSGLSARLTDSSGGSAFLPGGSMNLVISSLMNYGMGTAQVAVKVQSNKVATMDIDFVSSSLPNAEVVENVATVPRDIQRGSYDVTVTVGGARTSVSYQVGWDPVVRSFGEMDRSARNYNDVLDYLVKELQAEYKKATKGANGGKNIYNNSETNDSLVEQMLNVVKTLDSSAQGNYRSVKSQLKKAFGKRPGFMSWNDKKAWDAATKLVDSM